MDNHITLEKKVGKIRGFDICVKVETDRFHIEIMEPAISYVAELLGEKLCSEFHCHFEVEDKPTTKGDL